MQRSLGSFSKFCLSIIAIIVSYYVAVLLHEWGHGMMAWIFGYKTSPFAVQYGGWLLHHVDEAVPYPDIVAAGHGVRAALIGIAGTSTNIILLLFCLYVLRQRKTQSTLWLYMFFYWFACVNVIPIFQYMPVQTFSLAGDTGWFIHGLAISPWWVFIPGTIFVAFVLYYLFRHVVPQAYAVLGMTTTAVRRLFLLLSLFVIFLFIYTGGYNPLSDPGMPRIGKIGAVLYLLLVPLLFFVCNPSRKWVKARIARVKAGKQ